MKPKEQTQKSIQTIINVASIAAILFLIVYIFILKNDRIVYVDSGKIMNEYKGAIQAKKAYEAKTKSWQANIDTLTLDFQNGMRKYEKDMAGMSAKEKELSKQLLNSKQKQLNDYQRAIQENARQEDGKLYQGIVTEINAFLLKYGKDHNYKMILIANQSGTIAYAREGLDVTAEVLKELNK
ncbi:OmpH family outer membrane protein [Pedobacter africanus]|uniref:Periplasmic chaperone for outer membrane proteins Skp n=1 Tax=Pedobacter africanus TaxID=151894 RepID=A0A1W2BS43_9SPHI|nr:OmpH family outer membrane protein [Pedobacter africanus]SMC75388.1 periplasmic chaperone for outer membrane proteins Skp [Pedobacter africanus]